MILNGNDRSKCYCDILWYWWYDQFNEMIVMIDIRSDYYYSVMKLTIIHDIWYWRSIERNDW